MINGPWMMLRAKAFARRVGSDSSLTLEQRVATAYSLAFGRPPTRGRNSKTRCKFLQTNSATQRRRPRRFLPRAAELERVSVRRLNVPRRTTSRAAKCSSRPAPASARSPFRRCWQQTELPRCPGPEPASRLPHHPAQSQIRHLPLHGRRPEPPRHVRSQAGAGKARRPAAAGVVQARDPGDGRKEPAAHGQPAQVGAARRERPVGQRLAAAHGDVCRRSVRRPLALVRRPEPLRRRLPDEHRLDPRRPAVARRVGQLRPGDREREPARVRRDGGQPGQGRQRPAELGRRLHARRLSGHAARSGRRADSSIWPIPRT